MLFVLANQADAGQPLSTEGLVQLHTLGINADAVVQKISADGIGFTPDDATIAKLAGKGVPTEVLTAAKSASAAPKPAGNVITYANVKQLVALGIDESAIIERLSSSPTIFTLDANQEQELRAAGASDKLFAALRGERVAPSTKSAEKVTDIALILDCSGSMNETTSDGKTKIDVARSVVANMIQKYPAGLRVSLIVYGDTTGVCNDVRVVRPLSTLDNAAKGWLNSEVHQLQAKGKTPIAFALRRAGQEQAKFDADSSVVLIYDGIETSNGEPAYEAAALAQRFNLRYGVTVFGFAVAGAERTALEEIAAAGNGQYFNAESAEALVQQTTSVQAEIEVEPVKITKRGRRAVVVKTPRIEFPALKRIALIDANDYLAESHNYKAVTESNSYDRSIRIPSGQKSYDLLFVPQAGLSVRMVSALQIPDRSTIQVQPEDYLGLVNLAGEGLPPAKLVALVKVGDYGTDSHNFRPIQTADRYGADLMVPTGEYDLWILGQDGQSELLEEKLEVKAGERLQLD